MPIPSKSNAIISQHQLEENLYQEILTSLMSLKLDVSSQQQYIIAAPPAPLMSLRPFLYHSSSSKSNNLRTKFYRKKRVYNRFKYNPKYHYRIDRRESHRHRQTCKYTAKLTIETTTNVKAASTVQKVASRREQCETVLTSNENSHDIYIATDIETTELSPICE